MVPLDFMLDLSFPVPCAIRHAVSVELRSGSDLFFHLDAFLRGAPRRSIFDTPLKFA
jgi:hypothetical protein